jgi:teichoic acid transport system permease protein
MTAPTRETASDFEPVYHRYGPHRAGLPPLVPYFRELWHRRGFAAEMSRATMRGDKTSTYFGQAWLVINPLLLASVYYLLITILRGRHDPLAFVHLTLALFAFHLISSSINAGTKSVVSSGKLLINTALIELEMRWNANSASVRCTNAKGSCRPRRIVISR